MPVVGLAWPPAPWAWEMTWPLPLGTSSELSESWVVVRSPFSEGSDAAPPQPTATNSAATSNEFRIGQDLRLQGGFHIRDVIDADQTYRLVLTTRAMHPAVHRIPNRKAVSARFQGLQECRILPHQCKQGAASFALICVFLAHAGSALSVRVFGRSPHRWRPSPWRSPPPARCRARRTGRRWCGSWCGGARSGRRPRRPAFPSRGSRWSPRARAARRPRRTGGRSEP